MRAAVARHDALCCGRPSPRIDGHVFRTVGDGLCAAFATAPDAVAAALAAQQALARRAWGEIGPLRVRMALHTGAAEVQDGDYFGACLNRLGRLLAAGHGGQVLLSQATADLARARCPCRREPARVWASSAPFSIPGRTSRRRAGRSSTAMPA